MGCTTCSGNPNTWCTQCMPAEDTWVAPVDKLPDVFMGDRDHMYLLPNGDLFILSPDRTRWIKVNGQGGGVTYDDTAVINRLKALEGKTDNFISTVGVSRNGNRVKLTYTLVDGTIKEVEFEDKDTVALAYDDSALKARVKALEDKPVTPTGVNTFFAKGDISGNGTSQNVRVTKDKLVNADTIKVGDTVVDRYWNKDLYNIGMFKVASVNGNDVVLNGVNDLTYRHPKQSLTLSDRVLSISEGNSVTLPNDNQTISKQGNKLILSNGGGEVELPVPNTSVPYDDTAVINRLKALEGKTDNFISTVGVSRNGNRVKLTYTLVDGTIKEVEFEDKDTVALAYDDSALKARVKALEDKPVTPTGVNTFFAKGDISGNGTSQNVRVTKDKLVNADTIKVGDTVVDRYWNKDLYNIGMFKVASVNGNDVVLNGVNDLTYRHPKQSLTLSDRVLSISEGNSVTLPNDNQTISKQGNKLILSNGGGEVELPVPNTSVPYDDTALKKRVSDLEARPDNDKQTLTVNNNTLSISGGNSVTLPSQSIHRFYDGDIPGTADTNNTRTVQKTNFRNPDGIKVGDTVEDFYSDQNIINRGIWKVIEVSGNNVKVQGIGNYSTSLWKNLTFNANTRELSLSGGNKVTLPQYVSPEEFTTLKNEYNKLKGAFEKLLQDLKGSGAWKQTGGTIFEGNLYPDRHIATGNINLFGGTVDGSAFIRTNNGKTENDLAGGIS